jgi:hypothetical protein
MALHLTANKLLSIFFVTKMNETHTKNLNSLKNKNQRDANEQKLLELKLSFIAPEGMLEGLPN